MHARYMYIVGDVFLLLLQRRAPRFRESNLNNSQLNTIVTQIVENEQSGGIMVRILGWQSRDPGSIPGCSKSRFRNLYFVKFVHVFVGNSN